MNRAESFIYGRMQQIDKEKRARQERAAQRALFEIAKVDADSVVYGDQLEQLDSLLSKLRPITPGGEPNISPQERMQLTSLTDDLFGSLGEHLLPVYRVYKDAEPRRREAKSSFEHHVLGR